jgi:drug/metabolite transporter (DMT)-like permease
MRPAYLALVLTVVSNLLYHVAQKSVPREASPLLSVAVNYVVALALTLVLIPFFPTGQPLGIALRQLNWASWAVGVSIVGVELGFLLAYRAGWPISTAAVTNSVALALLLLPAGLLLFRESLSPARLLGVALCGAGLWLVSRP